MFRSKKEKTDRKWPLFFFLFLIVVALGFKFYSWYWPVLNLTVNGKELKMYVADTNDHLYKGLSGRDSLNGKDGMVFVFKEVSQHTMTMKDMKFPLDIVWVRSLKTDNNTNCTLNSFGVRKLLSGAYHSCKGVIVDIAPNLQIETQGSLTPYLARQESTMVLEFPAGYTKENNFKIGDIVEEK